MTAATAGAPLVSEQLGSGGVAARPVAEAIGVSKRFGASQALRDVSIAIPTGDSRALVGRNGAGKSTLVAALTGLIAPDEGRIRLAGEDAPALSQRERWRERVACVYQKSTVIPTLTVAENLFLNAQPVSGPGWINWASLRRQAERALADWGLEIDVTMEAAGLTVEQRQIVEIARALRQGTRFIILDEPTAQLEGREVTRLFERIERLQQAGVTFLYISHHLEEIYEICHTVTVMRDGQVVANAALADMPKEAVVDAMVGDVPRATHERAKAGTRGQRACLQVRRLTIDAVARDVTFAIDKGECVGLAGLAGSGKDEVGDAIAGLIRPTSGEITVDDQALHYGNVAAVRQQGVGYVPRDRHGRGIIPQLSVAENVTMNIIERLGQGGVIWPQLRDREARRMIQSLQVVTSTPEQPIGELSGGNQQKTVMGRALAADPKVLVLVQPTQGVDIASKEALFGIVDKTRAGGTAVLVVSDDLDELMICDRILVIFQGRLIAEFGSEWQDAELVAAIEGVGFGEQR
jgi:simple sugar transport system ATP-binding protein